MMSNILILCGNVCYSYPENTHLAEFSELLLEINMKAFVGVNYFDM